MSETIVIEVRGGVVEAVYAGYHWNKGVIVVDWDNKNDTQGESPEDDRGAAEFIEAQRLDALPSSTREEIENIGGDI